MAETDRGRPRFTNLFRVRLRPDLAARKDWSMNVLSFKRVGFAFAVLLSIVFVDDSWGQQYTLTDLGTIPGGFGSRASAINNLGQVVGAAINNLGGNNAFLYSNGSMQDLGVGGAGDINNLGQVLLSNSNGTFLYSGGSMQNIGNVSATAINNFGQVVGSSYSYASETRAILYSDGSMQNLGTLPSPFDYSSTAHDINDNGQIVGSSYADGWSGGGPRTGRAFLYSGGSMQDLGTLTAPYDFSSYATGINNLGQIVGYSIRYSGTSKVFLYSGGSMHDLGAGEPIAINNLGQVLLNSTFLYSGGVMQNLNSLIVPGSGCTFQVATDINDSGQICGYGTNPSGLTVALLLTPTSNPQPPPISWKGGNDDTSTAWGVGNNWSTGYVPDGSGANVKFGTQPANCPIVDMVTIGRTVGNITFSATTCTTIRSTYGFALTLDNNSTPSTFEVAGSHTISARVIINNDTTISGSGILNLSGGISGKHTLTILGNLTAASIQIDTLTVGSTGATAVPEPSTILLFGVGAFGLLVWAWRRKPTRPTHGPYAEIGEK